ncbi:hypothetical protein ILP92_10090 [Maribius pontilimi]|uniref:Uncharacterized protein n=1 Tax=Palleronia pontilimi TaxID=1964209 RepID=A0A934IJI3_9RHOB|nr:hypothetical protein [Palleronia pontilimi]MBJ3763094.1 hypothetical protein [Palleronia pontilimi]
MTMIERLKDIISKRAQYNRTAGELRHLPLETQIDLDLNGRDTDAIARRAVYDA